VARNLRILATDDPCIVQARVDTHKKNRQKKFIFSIFFRGEKFARRMSMTDASASPKMSQRILAMNPTCIVLKIRIFFFCLRKMCQECEHGGRFCGAENE